MFEKSWSEEALEIENQHLQSLSLILEFSHKIKNEQWMINNPIELRKNDHGVEFELPNEINVFLSL